MEELCQIILIYNETMQRNVLRWHFDQLSILFANCEVIIIGRESFPLIKVLDKLHAIFIDVNKFLIGPFVGSNHAKFDSTTDQQSVLCWEMEL